jgi:signal transduction histidine kinase
MKIGVGTPQALARPLQYLTSATAVVIAVGLVGSVLAAANASQVSKDLILSRAVTAARAFSGEEVLALKGDARDLESDTYQSLKRRLVSIRQGNSGTRFAYLLGMKDNQVIFLADSEPQTSKDYSPPGSSYSEATGLLRSVFFNHDPIIEGPSQDSYGNWVSGLAPVTDETGKIVAVLGIDIPARDYYQQIATYAVIPLLLAAIPAAVLVYNRRLARKEHEITELKTQFVSIASHELRSPLTGTLWGVQSLIKSNPKKTQEKTLKSVYNNVASSLATVNEILDFSIFDRGKAGKLQHDIVDLRDVLSDVQKLHELAAEAAKLGIYHAGAWPEQALTVGDQGALKRALSNIVSNAIKYSPDGSKIEIALHTEGGKHIIGVRDHGIGIPKSEQRKVLQGYYRAANAAKVKTYGTGMGLWVTRMIVEQHQGRLWLESRENEGTTFFISLPAKTSRP